MAFWVCAIFLFKRNANAFMVAIAFGTKGIKASKNVLLVDAAVQNASKLAIGGFCGRIAVSPLFSFLQMSQNTILHGCFLFLKLLVKARAYYFKKRFKRSSS